MNYVQPIGFDDEPTACIDADLSAVRAIEKDLAEFLAKAKARIAEIECAESKRLLEDLDDCVAVVRSDCLSVAADALDQALSARDDDGRVSYWRSYNQEMRAAS